MFGLTEVPLPVHLDGGVFNHLPEPPAKPSLVHRCMDKKDFFNSIYEHPCENAKFLPFFRSENPDRTSVYCTVCDEVWTVPGKVETPYHPDEIALDTLRSEHLIIGCDKADGESVIVGQMVTVGEDGQIRACAPADPPIGRVVSIEPTGVAQVVLTI